jgi:AraC-like DNA-binding protein
MLHAVENAPGKPRYIWHPRLGIETVAYRGPLERMPTHAHAEYQVTLYDGAPRRFRVAGADFAGGPRASIVIQAGEPHSSIPVADELLALRTFYVDERLMAELAADLWHGVGTAAFRGALLDDPATVRRLRQAHRALDRRAADADEKACLALAQLVRRHAAPTGARRALTSADPRLARARDLLDDRAAADVRLDELAAVAGLSRFHLIRLFQRKYGLTPFAYQRSRRVELARAALRLGRPIAAAAAEAGFSDQSHLGRAFRAAMGATPGAYRASYVQPARRT